MAITKITAKTVEEFKAANDLLESLPEKIKTQITEAEFNCFNSKLSHLLCIIPESEISIILPKEVSQIKNFGDYTMVYCDKFFFKILGNKNIYIFFE